MSPQRRYEEAVARADRADARAREAADEMAPTLRALARKLREAAESLKVHNLVDESRRGG